ncbi:hypothetical protein [Sphingobium sp. SCG-1]|nr:hypothetical protein [Sphingobium sp. SCG-1]
MIDNVAQTTTMLAFNVTMEAARVGELGKGLPL